MITTAAKRWPNANRLLVRALILLVALFVPMATMADGVVVRLRAAEGPFLVTIFSPADAASGLPTEVTVMVQRRDSGAAVLDAVVELSLTPPVGAPLIPGEVICGPAGNMPLPGTTDAVGQAGIIRATHQQAGNKLLYRAPLILRATGDWQLGVTVRKADETATLACALPVGAPPRRLATLWPYLALPPIAIGIFAMNQWLRRNARNPFLGGYEIE